MKDLLRQIKPMILGNMSLAYYISLEFFALLALLLSLYLHAQVRNPASSNTPPKFSWYFLIADNFKRILAGQVTLFLIFRFYTEITGHELNMWAAVGVGFSLSFGLDKVIQWMKGKTTLFDMDRQALVPPSK